MHSLTKKEGIIAYAKEAVSNKIPAFTIGIVYKATDLVSYIQSIIVRSQTDISLLLSIRSET